MKVTSIRAQNGWILEEEREHEYGDGVGVIQEVFEDEEHQDQEYAQAKSLYCLLWSAFQQNFQSKWSPGIVVEVKEKSREQEYQEEAEERYYDFGEAVSLTEDPVEAFKDYYPLGDENPETD